MEHSGIAGRCGALLDGRLDQILVEVQGIVLHALSLVEAVRVRAAMSRVQLDASAGLFDRALTKPMEKRCAISLRSLVALCHQIVDV